MNYEISSKIILETEETEKSKKKLICKNGSVFPDKCSKHPVDISVCDCDINCGCVKQCNRMKCVNGQDLFLDGCNGCEPKCKIDCRDRQTCISDQQLWKLNENILINKKNKNQILNLTANNSNLDETWNFKTE